MTGVYALQLLTGNDDHYGLCLSMRTVGWDLQGEQLCVCVGGCVCVWVCVGLWVWMGGGGRPHLLCCKGGRSTGSEPGFDPRAG
jgi:hypothetical protein